MRFKDRAEAATLLAQRLSKYRGRNPLILAIPRGAVPMARIIADALDGEVDVVLVRKLRAPGNPELAIGSIDEAGHVELAEHAKDLWITDEYLLHEEHAQLTVLRTRRELYSAARPPADATDRVVIVLDDGVATGSTMMAALSAVRARRPARLVAAMAVAPPETRWNACARSPTRWCAWRRRPSSTPSGASSGISPRCPTRTSSRSCRAQAPRSRPRSRDSRLPDSRAPPAREPAF